MKTFSRLTIFVFLGITLMLVGGTADAQTDPFLEVVGSEGFEASRTGDGVQVTFQAGYDGVGAANISLMVTATPNVTNIIINGAAATVPGTYMTDGAGYLVVEGEVPPNVNAEITATWEIDQSRTLNAAASTDIPGIGPVLIVVNPPNPKTSLAIGDTFTQIITIENEGLQESLPLSAWQMDVVYNPLILEVDEVTEGDFLTEAGTVETHYTAMLSYGRVSVSQARAGITAGAASAPSPAGIPVEPGDSGTLLTIKFRVLAVSEEALGIHNVKLQSDTDFDGLPTDENGDPIGVPDRISYSIKVLDVAVTTMQSSVAEDVNQDGMVNIQDLVVVAGSIGMVPYHPRADVNGDGAVNVLDLIQIYSSDHWGGAVDMDTVAEANVPGFTATAPTANRNVTPTTIQSWIDLARVEDDGSVIFDRGIENLEALLASQIPSQTKLLLNYPNPFNPETWIPYQLAKASDVTVMIHSMNGSLIRTLELGHQTAGIYKSKSHAAYWDGRNELGEHVASGLYFYTLTAGKFSATGKMLVRK